MNKWFTYILLCDQKTFYVGITTDLKSRIGEHKNKESFFTKKFSNIELVYSEEHDNKFKAATREKQLKGWGHNKKQLLINNSL